MSERWKYQLKIGLFWGILMTLFNMFFKMSEIPISKQLSTQAFYIRGFVFIIGGIFIIGYFQWREKMKQRK